MTDPALTPEEEAQVVAALLHARNDHSEPTVCDGCWAMADFLVRSGIGVLDAARKDEPGLDAKMERVVLAAWRVSDEADRSLLIHDTAYEGVRDALVALRAALATPPTDAGLDMERLARAIERVWRAGHDDLRSGLTTWVGNKPEDTLAGAIAREYGAER